MAIKNNSHADNDKDQGEKPAGTSIDTLMEEGFEELDDSSENDGKPGSSGDGGEGDQDKGEGGSGSEGAGNGAEDGQPPKPPVRKWGGQFDTPEEMEAAYIASLRPKGETEPGKSENKDKDQLPDLTEQELLVMSEQDASDGTKFMEEYLRRKMQTRNLQKHEVAAARKIDTDSGTDLLGDYYEMRALRRVRQETAPLVRRSQEESQKAFASMESAIDKSNVDEFGEESLADLEKFCGDPKNVEQVLQRSPLAHLIIHEHERGSPATAHKLLLREADTFRRNDERIKAQGKKKRSVPADAGGPGRGKSPKDTAATVEEAFEASEEEQGQ
jgi:hypothetical protein